MVSRVYLAEPPLRSTTCAAIFGLTIAGLAMPAYAEDWFNPALLGVGAADNSAPGSAPASGIDEKTLQLMANGQQPPGAYVLDVKVNGLFMDKRNIMLTADGPEASLTPKWSVNEVLGLGVKEDVLAADTRLDMTPEQGDTPVTGILNFVPGSQVRLDFASQTLHITIPDMLMVKTMSGATDPRFWDHGITALVTDYNLSAWRRQGQGDQSDTETDSAFLSMDNSLNMGPWRLNNFSTWSRTKDKNKETGDTTNEEEFENVNTWLERPIAQLKGLLSVGDFYTPDDVFDSIQFRGAQLASDEEMNPDQMNDFAPIVRGTASTNAQVIIRQNGSIVYQTSVPPGPFSITDIPSAMHGGDLYVTVKEADGTQHSFIQGNAAVAVMQRAGELRYAFTGGQLRNSGEDTREPEFMQGTLIYGLPHDLTVYGGLLGSQEYQSGNLGIGALLGVFGAASVDVTHAKTDRAGITGNDEDGTDSGQSWRFRYSKTIGETGSSLSVSALNNSSGGYWSFNDAYSLDSGDDDQDYIFSDDGNISVPVINGRTRKELQISLTQSLGEDFGSLGINATKKNFHDLEGEQTSVSINWNTAIADIEMGIGFQMSKWPDKEQEDEQIVSLNFSLPLQKWLGIQSSVYANSNYTHSDKGRQTLNNNVGGTLLEDNNLSWSVGQTSIRPGDEGGKDTDNGNVNLSYSGGQGEISAGYSYAPDNQQYDLGLKGGVIVSRYGLTFSQRPGETTALVHAPGADDVSVVTGSGITTDRFGNTAVQVQPYQRNKIDLDVLSSGRNATLVETSKVVIPTRGAVVLAKFDTEVGYQVLMNLTRQGKPLPFGAMVNLVQDSDSSKSSRSGGNGIVGDGGQIWLSGMPEKGVLNVVWGEGSGGTCKIPYTLNTADIKAAEEKNLPVSATGVCS